MIAPPPITSLEEHRARVADVAFWWPYVTEILERHALDGSGQEVAAGYNATYPTFVCGDVVVKLFGAPRVWRRGHAAERAAHAAVASDPAIAAPGLLAEGRLVDDDDAPWPYLVTTRMAGASWRDATLSDRERRSVAAELGERVRRVHALRPSDVPTVDDWDPPSLTEAARRSSLPPHLVAQVEDYAADLPAADPVFVHGDLCANHVFVEAGRLAGIIDWGDALVADPHHELIQLYRDTFDCDKDVFRVFLDACDWPVRPDFARRTLGHALRRQAVGLAQHHGMDVFEPIAAAFPLADIATLDELAPALFAL